MFSIVTDRASREHRMMTLDGREAGRQMPVVRAGYLRKTYDEWRDQQWLIIPKCAALRKVAPLFEIVVIPSANKTNC